MWTLKTRTAGRRCIVRPVAIIWRWSSSWWSRALACLPPRCPITRRRPKSAKRTRRVSTVAPNTFTVRSFGKKGNGFLQTLPLKSVHSKCSSNFAIFSFAILNILGIQEKLGILNSGEVYAVFSYDSQQTDELNFGVNDRLVILRKGDDAEREWWWARLEHSGHEGYVPRNLLGVSCVVGFWTWEPLNARQIRSSTIPIVFIALFLCSSIREFCCSIRSTNS